VGQSWLFHGFCALASNFRAARACNRPIAATWASAFHYGYRLLTGSQVALGPKWQVNPTTGAFVFPPANPAYSGAIAAACRQAWSISIQRIPSSSGRSRSPPTTPRRQRLEQWGLQARDPERADRRISRWRCRGPPRHRPPSTPGGTRSPRRGITRSAVGAGGPRRRHTRHFRVRPRHPRGLWHYEYALYNTNSDAGVGSFSVPVPDSAVVLNAQFHGVAYTDATALTG